MLPHPQQIQRSLPGWAFHAALALASAAALSSAFAANSPKKPKKIEPSSPPVEQQLKAAVEQSRSKLGELDVNQKRIFEEEVVPGYSYFIRDYRPTDHGLSIEVDEGSIRSYLQLEGGKVAGGSSKSVKVLAYLKAELGCPKCLESAPGIRKLLASRLQARGWVPVWLAPGDIPGTSLTTQALEDKVSEIQASREAVGSVILQWSAADSDDIDTVHPDEHRFKIHSWVSFKGISKAEGELDLTGSDSFEQSAGRLLTDAWTELGHQLLLTPVVVSESDKPEVWVKVKNIPDFSHLMQAQSQLRDRLKEVALVEQRKISRNEAVFGVQSSKSPDEIKKLLEGLPLQWEVP